MDVLLIQACRYACFSLVSLCGQWTANTTAAACSARGTHCCPSHVGACNTAHQSAPQGKDYRVAAYRASLQLRRGATVHTLPLPLAREYGMGFTLSVSAKLHNTGTAFSFISRSWWSPAVMERARGNTGGEH